VKGTKTVITSLQLTMTHNVPYGACAQQQEQLLLITITSTTSVVGPQGTAGQVLDS